MAKALKPVIARVKVDGYSVVTYSYGSGDEVLFLLNGGPGLPCNYLREPLIALADQGFRVVTYDQLGCGRSDKPTDKSLWNISRYVEEVETVLRALDLPPVHLLGHSWGGWLGIEFALTYLGSIRTLILSNTCGDMPHLVSELNRLRGALGSETVAMMQRYEALGQFDHPAYKGAITVLNYRHVLRLDVAPKPAHDSLKDWNRIPDMHRITVPTLVMCGQHDEMTPVCAMRMQRALPDAEITVFPNSSHMPIYEEADAYLARLTKFLGQHRRKKSAARRRG